MREPGVPLMYSMSIFTSVKTWIKDKLLHSVQIYVGIFFKTQHIAYQILVTIPSNRQQRHTVKNLYMLMSFYRVTAYIWTLGTEKIHQLSVTDIYITDDVLQLCGSINSQTSSFKSIKHQYKTLINKNMT